MYIQCGISRGLTAGVDGALGSSRHVPSPRRPHPCPVLHPPPMGLNNGISFDTEVLYQSGTQAGWRKVWD